MKWKTRDGVEMNIKDMTIPHLVNTIKMLESNAEHGVSVGYLDYGYDGDSWVPPSWEEVEVLKGKKYLATTKWKHLKKELELRKTVIKKNNK